MRDIAKEQDATPAQIGIAWLASKGHIVLLGARTLEQFNENLGALDVQLTQDQLGQLEEITKSKTMYPNWMIERQSMGRSFDITRPAWAE